MARERYRDRLEVFGFAGGHGLQGVLKESLNLINQDEDDFDLPRVSLRYENGTYYLTLPFTQGEDIEINDGYNIEYIKEESYGW